MYIFWDTQSIFILSRCKTFDNSSISIKGALVTINSSEDLIIYW